MDQTAQMILTPQSTIQEAKAFLRERWEKGTECPCCTQHVQKYSRPITSAMAMALIILYKECRKGGRHVDRPWIHAETMLKGADCPASIRGDFSKLKYWGLIYPKEEMEGYYDITVKGILFVEGKVKVESHVMLYNNKYYGTKGDYVSIKDCLKKKFNYEKLMEGTL